MIVTPVTTESTAEYTERYGGWATMATRGRVGLPGVASRRGGDPFPVAYVIPEARDRIVAHVTAPASDWKPGLRLGPEWVDRRAALGADTSVESRNVCGLWPGSDPQLSKEWIIVSAHYDHVGTASSGDIYNGADDNGSGTAALLAIAEALQAMGPLKRSVLLIWVCGEEKGLLGSRAWVDAPHLPEGVRVVANVNMDMVGRNAADQILITPSPRMTEEYNALSQLVHELAPSEGFTQVGSADKYWRRSDHASFATLGIPVVFLFADVHDDYHKPSDTVEKIDHDKIGRVARLVLRTLMNLGENGVGP
jgi:Zn-dependent M28 family amino/carboxypeptidase